jgi:hypothetical protein
MNEVATYLQRIPLTNAATTYIRERLSNGKPFSESVLATSNPHTGQLYISAAPASIFEIPDFQIGSSSLNALLNTSGNRVQRLVQDFVRRPEYSVLFEHQLARRGDAWIDKQKHHATILYYEQHVFQLLHTNDSQTVFAFLQEATACHNCIGYVVSSSLSSNHNGELSIECIRKLIKCVQAVILCAFDEAGYLVWFPSSTQESV